MRKVIERRKQALVFTFAALGTFLPLAAILISRLAPFSTEILEKALIYVNLGSPALFIISAAFVLRQVHEIFETRLQTHFEEISSSIHRMGVFMLENPDLYPYFNEGLELGEEMSPSDRYRALSLAAVMADILDGILLRCETFPQAASTEDIEALQTWARDCFSLSPVMRSYVLDNEGWYRESFVRFVRSSLRVSAP